MSGAEVRSNGMALPLALVLLPGLGAVYQFAATKTAWAGAGVTSPGRWLHAVITTPWFWILLVSEAMSFCFWTSLLARMPLSRAFPISAIGYVIVLAVAVVVLHEPLRPLAVLGSVAILAGGTLLAVDPA